MIADLAVKHRLPAIYNEREFVQVLIAMSPDVIVVVGAPATTMLAKLTNTIPIIFISAGDPVMAGNVQSFAHPSRNITGFVNFEVSINGKYLQLLKDIAPQVTRVAVVQSGTSLWRDDLSVIHPLPLLRPCHQCPHRCPTEPCNELAPSHLQSPRLKIGDVTNH
jgi:ABC transporter substrate binding protein